MKLKKGIEELWNHWCSFWFECDGRKQLALFRPALALLMFYFSMSKSFDLQVFYSDSGIMPLSVLELIPGSSFRVSILKHFTQPGFLVVLQGVFLLSLALLALNIQPRWTAICAYFIHVTYLNRNLAGVYGADTVSTFFLFYLCFADFRGPSTPRKRDLQAILGSISYRLSQLQLCIIYAYAGLDKARGGSWWGGDAMWYVLANHQLAHIPFDWISHFPVLIVLLTHGTLFWEIYFPILVWIRQVRYPVLLFGVVLHLGIIIAMGLKSFGILMILPYLLFLRDEDAVRAAQGVKKYFNTCKVFLRPTDQIIV